MAEATTTAPSWEPCGVEFKIPVYDSIKSAADEWGDGKLSPGDIGELINVHLDVLGFALNPLKAVVSAPLDWLMDLFIENITPLK